MDVLAVLLLRSFTFIFAFAIFPNTVVPLTVRIAISCGLVLFAFPQAFSGAPADAVFESLLLNPETSFNRLWATLSTPGILFREFAVGLLLGVSAGFGSFLCQLLSGWIVGLIQSADEEITVDWKPGSLQSAFLLMYLSFLVPLLPALFAVFSESLSVFPVGPAVERSAGLFHEYGDMSARLQMVMELGRLMFLLSLILSLPFLGANLFLLALVIPIERSTKGFLSDSLLLAIRYPVFLVILIAVFFTFAEGLTTLPRFALETLGVDWLRSPTT